MLLKDLEFIIPTFENVVIDEFFVDVDDDQIPHCFIYPGKEWYKINGLDREIISISAYNDGLVIKVYGK